jgi:hypothetical protein
MKIASPVRAKLSGNECRMMKVALLRKAKAYYVGDSYLAE